MAPNKDNARNTVIAAIVVAGLVCLAAGAFVVLKLGLLPTANAGGSEAGVTQWKLDEFIVNLADHEEVRYLKVNIVLEISGKVASCREDAANPEEIKARDAIITTLTKKTYRDLLSENGKTALKAELKEKLNSVLSGLEVTNIYFTSFAMQ